MLPEPPTDRWRIGTAIDGAGEAVTVVEQAGRIVALAELLAGVRTGPAGEAPAGLRGLLQDWPTWRTRIRVALAAGIDRVTPIDPAGWLPAVPDPPKILCVGVNYRDHLVEMGSAEPPERPFVFVKPENTLLGHEVPLQIPRQVRKLDWEAELAVVVGAELKDVTVTEALAGVAGYLPFNDVSARDWITDQIPGLGMDWLLHKSFDGFAPTGGLMTPAEFVPDPQALRIRTLVNEVAMQDSNTSMMVFGVGELLAQLSQVVTLRPGDLVATGTPAGVGHGRGVYLAAGDVVRIEIEGVGSVSTPIAGG